VLTLKVKYALLSDMITVENIVDMFGGKKISLARAANVKKQAVSQWKRIPAGRVLAIEAALDHKISRHQIRPDIYPKEEGCGCPSCSREREMKGAA